MDFVSRIGDDPVGCHADGALGHDHVRERMAEYVSELGNAELAARLRAEMSDDAEEEHEALDALNKACEGSGLMFVLEGGDLLCVKE